MVYKNLTSNNKTLEAKYVYIHELWEGVKCVLPFIVGKVQMYVICCDGKVQDYTLSFEFWKGLQQIFLILSYLGIV